MINVSLAGAGGGVEAALVEETSSRCRVWPTLREEIRLLVGVVRVMVRVVGGGGRHRGVCAVGGKAPHSSVGRQEGVVVGGAADGHLRGGWVWRGAGCV